MQSKGRSKNSLAGQRLVIRADAGPLIGSGHVMRCLALAQAWQDTGGQVTLVLADESPSLEARLRSEKVEVVHLPDGIGLDEDAAEVGDIASRTGAHAIVVDGYRFDAEYQRAIKDRDLYLLFVDDNQHAEHYYADVVLNQNVYAGQDWYADREPRTQRLLGTQYALLRREFRQWHDRKKQIPKVARRVLVTLGGGDAGKVTLKVVRALQQVKLDGLEVTVVIGAINPHTEELESAIEDSGVAVRVERDVTNMPELMAWADVAVTGGGSTCWETAYMGLPACVLVLADNQERNVTTLGRLGQAVDLGRANEIGEEKLRREIQGLMIDRPLRWEMSRQGRALVDGQGARRVVALMRTAHAELATR